MADPQSAYLNLLRIQDIADTGQGVYGGNLTPAGHSPEGEYNRGYAIGSQHISRITPKKSPFLVLANSFSRRPTDDPIFKSKEEYADTPRRYAVLVGQTNSVTTNDFASGGWTGTKWNNTLDATRITGLKLGTDFTYGGKFSFDRRTLLGSEKTAPYFISNNTTLNIPVCHAVASDSLKVADNGMFVIVVDKVTMPTAANEVDRYVYVDGTIVKAPKWNVEASDFIYYGYGAPGYDAASQVTNGGTFITTRNLSQVLGQGDKVRREDRIHLTGSAHSTGTGLPGNTYKRDSYVGFGYCQIFKNDLGMDYTTIATRFKDNPNMFQRYLLNMMENHKEDIARTGLFGSMHIGRDSEGNERRFSKGMFEFIEDQAWIFDLSPDDDINTFAKTFSEFNHPDYGVRSGKMVYHVSTNFLDWINDSTKGFVSNTILDSTRSFAQYSSSMRAVGEKTFQGLDIKQVRMHSATMNLVHDPMLDSTFYPVVGVNYSKMDFRPLIGNISRDTTFYPKAQDVSTNGVDARRALVITEAGYDFYEPNAWCAWKMKPGT